MLEINRTLLHFTILTCLYVGFKAGQKWEKIKETFAV